MQALVSIAILLFFAWAVESVVKQLRGIEARLSEIRDRLPELENAPGQR